MLKKTSLALLLILFLATSCGRLIPNKPYATKAKNSVRVASYNVNWGKGEWGMKNPLKTIAVMKKLDADIVLLQETTPQWQQLIRQYLKKQFPYQAFRHYHNAGGLAILSRYPFHTKRYQKPSYGWHPYWLVSFQSPLGHLQVVNLHLTPSLGKDNDIGWFASAVFTTAKIRLKEIKQIVASLPHSRRTIIAGDFNEGDRSNSLRYLENSGFIDAVEQYKWPTWHWRCGPFLLTDRYDRVFYSTDLKVVNAQTLHAGSSDHFPVIVDFSN